MREIALIGPPASVQIGATAALRAVATYVDGGFVDVTKDAVWSSSHDACKVSPGGVVTGMNAGIAEITATLGSIRSAAVRVACGFVITVTTRESFPTGHVIVPGVAGEVLDGPLAGHQFTTGSDGRATLPPVAHAGFRLRFTKPGFENQFEEVRELPLDSALDVPMVPEFGMRQVFTGVCTWRADVSEFVPFTMPREGKLRVTAELLDWTTFPGFPPLAEVSGTVTLPRTDLRAAVDAATGAAPLTARVEGRTTAGDYRLEYRARQCGESARWRVTLEYPR